MKKGRNPATERQAGAGLLIPRSSHPTKAHDSTVISTPGAVRFPTDSLPGQICLNPETSNEKPRNSTHPEIQTWGEGPCLF